MILAAARMSYFLCSISSPDGRPRFRDFRRRGTARLATSLKLESRELRESPNAGVRASPSRAASFFELLLWATWAVSVQSAVPPRRSQEARTAGMLIIPKSASAQENAHDRAAFAEIYARAVSTCTKKTPSKHARRRRRIERKQRTAPPSKVGLLKPPGSPWYPK